MAAADPRRETPPPEGDDEGYPNPEHDPELEAEDAVEESQETPGMG